MILKQKNTQRGSVMSRNLKKIPRPIIDISFTGYAYGSKRGQIRDMTDHNHIIALYDYGVGTYDFDLDKVRSLAEFAQDAAENKTVDYFKNPN